MFSFRVRCKSVWIAGHELAEGELPLNHQPAAEPEEHGHRRRRTDGDLGLSER